MLKRLLLLAFLVIAAASVQADPTDGDLVAGGSEGGGSQYP